MKGIVLAGGTGSRLEPLTRVTNKHLLPVGNYPMIYHPIAKLKQAGLRDIMIVTGVDHVEDMVRLLGSGEQWNVNFSYRIQREAGGIAQALGLARDFARGEKMVVILGDNIFDQDISEYVTAFENQDNGARILLKEVDQPERFGVPELEDDRVTGIVEKPESPPSDYCVTGIYMYDSKVFDFVDSLEPSERGELEITDVNNMYIDRGHMHYDVLDSWWTDAGTFASYHRANDLARDLRLESLH